MNIIKLTLGTGEPIYVNMDLITCFTPFKEDRSILSNSAGNHDIVVKQSIEEIMFLINENQAFDQKYYFMNLKEYALNNNHIKIAPYNPGTSDGYY